MYDNPFIFILGIVSFLLSLFSTKEIFFNRSNLEPLGKISLVGKMVGIFLSVYSYILILVWGVVTVDSVMRQGSMVWDLN